jgi:hypothetical protein
MRRRWYTPITRGGYRCQPLAHSPGIADNPRMGRTKSSVKSRPKYKIARRLKGRKMKAKKKAAHKRGLGRSKARRRRRGTTKK